MKFVTALLGLMVVVYISERPVQQEIERRLKAIEARSYPTVWSSWAPAATGTSSSWSYSQCPSCGTFVYRGIAHICSQAIS